MEPPVILCGLGKVGTRVLQSLRAAGHPVVVISLNEPQSDLAGAGFVKGDCRLPELLESAGVKGARAVLIMTGDDLVNVSTALLVRRLNPDTRIVLRMFNEKLIPRLGASVKNIIALSVSKLTAPLLALSAVSGDVIGAFKIESDQRQVSEIFIADGSEFIGRKLAEVAKTHRVVPFAHIPATGQARFLLDVEGEALLQPGDRLLICGAPRDLRSLLERVRGDLLPGVQWAGKLRRWMRTFRRTLWEVDLSVKIATPVLFITLFVSTLIFRYGLDTGWGDGLYRTVSVVATGSDLGGAQLPEWAKVFLSVLKLAGAALIAGFTAILTNYLIRARLGGALEMSRVPDGGHVVVCGLGNIGYRCVEELTAIGERVVAIDRIADNPFIATCRRKGVPTFVGDATVEEVLRQLKAESARAVIASTSSELANLEIALFVREMNPAMRVVVRLTDPWFAEAVREAASIRFAVSVPELAAPAFTAALYGDRVHSLVTASGRTIAVVEFIVQEVDPCLIGKTLRAASFDYRLLPLALAGRDLDAALSYRLRAGDRLTAATELADLERLLRRESPPKVWSVELTHCPITANEMLVPLVRAIQHCSQEEGEKLLANGPFTHSGGLTRGEAEELHSQIVRERAGAKIIQKT